MDLFNLRILQQRIAKKIEKILKKKIEKKKKNYVPQFWGFPFQGWVAGLVQNTDDFERYVL